MLSSHSSIPSHLVLPVEAGAVKPPRLPTSPTSATAPPPTISTTRQGDVVIMVPPFYGCPADTAEESQGVFPAAAASELTQNTKESSGGCNPITYNSTPPLPLFFLSLLISALIRCIPYV